MIKDVTFRYGSCPNMSVTNTKICVMLSNRKLNKNNISIYVEKAKYLMSKRQNILYIKTRFPYITKLAIIKVLASCYGYSLHNDKNKSLKHFDSDRVQTFTNYSYDRRLEVTKGSTLTQCGLVTPLIWRQWSRSALPSGTKSLPEPMSTYHHIRVISREMPQTSITNVCLKITYVGPVS